MNQRKMEYYGIIFAVGVLLFLISFTGIGTIVYAIIGVNVVFHYAQKYIWKRMFGY